VQYNNAGIALMVSAFGSLGKWISETSANMIFKT
jgi:hypothetical protein